MNEPGYTAPDITLLGQEHIDRYRETDGEEGYLWNGATSLLLTTTGRKSGEPRTSALIFAQRRRRLPRGGVDGRRAEPPVVVPQPHREPRGRGPGEGRPRSR